MGCRVALLSIVMIISVLQQYINVHERTDGQDHGQGRWPQTDCSIALVLAAVALLPVDPVLQHAPVADPRHPGVWDTGAAPEHLPPPTIPDEASRPLLHNLHTEGSWNITRLMIDRLLCYLWAYPGCGSRHCCTPRLYSSPPGRASTHHTCPQICPGRICLLTRFLLAFAGLQLMHIGSTGSPPLKVTFVSPGLSKRK